jgi:LacI family transcriptional regulator
MGKIMKSKTVNSKNIAKALKVSRITLYRALNGLPYVKESTRKRILREIAFLNYKPDILGKSLKLKKSFIIGVIIPKFTDSFYPEIIEGLEEILDPKGYTLLLRSCYGTENIHDSVEILLSRHIDGLIVSHPAFPKPVFKYLRERGVPVVLVSHKIAGVKVPHVGIDNFRGGLTATQHLIDCGFHSITYVGGSGRAEIIKERFMGYKEALRMAKCPYGPRILEDISQLETFFKGIKEVPVAVFAANDFLAIQTVTAAHKAGMDIFKDLALVGFDDIRQSMQMVPSLTTVIQPKQGMARKAAEILLAMFNGKKPGDVLLPHRLIVRDTTRRFIRSNGDR